MLLRYPGSKERAAQDILSLAPLSYGEYREPFCGNATLLWFVPPDKRRWINDLDPDVVRFHRYLKRGKVEGLLELRERTLNANRDDMLRQFRLCILDWLLNNDPKSYWYARRLSYGQMLNRARNDLGSFASRQFRNGIQPCYPEKVRRACQIMKDVRITQGDYSALLDAPGDDVWIFLDPPYIIEDHSSPLYGRDMTLDEHRELADRLRVCKHKFLLTIGYCGLTQDLYCNSHFNWMMRTYRYGFIPYGGALPVDELIVTGNY